MTSFPNHDIIYYICQYISAHDVAALARVDRVMNNILRPALMREISAHVEYRSRTIITHEITRLRYLGHMVRHWVNIYERAEGNCKHDLILSTPANESLAFKIELDGYVYYITVHYGTSRFSTYTYGKWHRDLRSAARMDWIDYIDAVIQFHRLKNAEKRNRTSSLRNIIDSACEILAWVVGM